MKEALMLTLICFFMVLYVYQFHFKEVVKIKVEINNVEVKESILKSNAEFEDIKNEQLALRTHIDEVCHNSDFTKLRTVEDSFIIDKKHHFAYCQHAKVRTDKTQIIQEFGMSRIRAMYVLDLGWYNDLDGTFKAPITK